MLLFIWTKRNSHIFSIKSVVLIYDNFGHEILLTCVMESPQEDFLKTEGKYFTIISNNKQNTELQPYLLGEKGI
jgi:hypothetical protein